MFIDILNYTYLCFIFNLKVFILLKFVYLLDFIHTFFCFIYFILFKLEHDTTFGLYGSDFS